MNNPFLEVCRICLSTAVERDIRDLNVVSRNEDSDRRSYAEVLAFCLDIHVKKDTKRQKLCMKCYNKILSFYKFKCLALKNDATLSSFNPECTVKLEVFVREKSENEFDEPFHNDYGIDTYYNEQIVATEYAYSTNVNFDVKEEPDIKVEDVSPDCHTDDELLSQIKETKLEQSSKENRKKKALIKKKSVIKTQVVDGKLREMCPECGKAVWNLRLHANKHLPPDEKKTYKCSDCDKSFATYQSRKKHYKSKHLGIKKHCEICNKDVVNLTSHKRLMHERESLKSCCMFCKKRFLSPSLLEQHLLIHTEDRPHECDVCHKRFRLKMLMMHHKRAVHEKEKNLLCQFCPKSFFKKIHLDVHLRSHTKEKPYKCPNCDKFFASSTGMKKHLVLHTGERKYHCHLCDSSFAQYGNLAKHLVVHTREKKYKCKYCGLKFGRPDHKKRHEFTAHEKHLNESTKVTTT